MPNKIKFSQEQLEQMVKLHDEGMLNRELADYFHVSRSTIDRKLSEMNVASRHPWLTEERRNKAIELYLQYQNMSKVEKELRMNTKTVRFILENAGIKILPMAEVKKTCHINEQYFNNIDTPRKSYYLGLLYADGCASDRNHSITISLQERDRHIIESFNNDIESEYKIRFIDYKKKNCNYNNQYSLCITNKVFYENLVKQGVVPRKSLVLSFPTFLEESLIPSFLLGYMDGDGSINSKEGRCTFIGTEKFCETAASIVAEKLGIHVSIIPCHNKKTSTREWKISGRKQTRKFLDWLYNNSDIWLERKYQSYLEL